MAAIQVLIMKLENMPYASQCGQLTDFGRADKPATLATSTAAK
ncbi:hypothetical protein GGI1_19844 [Acidithiobacillus sp. GGI-221]|nr:hypothetical protein GGI1_19844 [Acidithiobacillus sp. GGI-221]